jgi:NADPH-dependent glutamate synthase beta subunit-like oxidoreductase
MDGQRVKLWEARCIEEQPPACTVACPLRVDARAMAEKIRAGDFGAALAIYARSIPLPGVLGRICDHPCQPACRRAEAGGAIRIGALERALVNEAYGTIRRAPQPSRRPKRVAIVGAGIAGLTAAFDLAMKGRAVTVFESEDRPLPRLSARYPADLPASAVDADVAALAAIGVAIQCGTRIGALNQPALEALIADHDAVLIATGADPSWTFAADLKLTPDGEIDVDPDTRAASNKKVFGAGSRRAPYSPIGSAADGRRAALSIDRMLQGASLTASRTDESGGSCLYVNVAAHALSPPVAPADPASGYDRDEAIAEAARCFPCRCMECVKACEYLKHYGSYPKRYVRDIYNNLSIVLGNRKANRMIDSCTMCGLCDTLCPNDLSMGEVCLEARRDMVESGHMPASHHDFALRDMVHSRSDAAAFARPQPGFETSAYAFFPGCQLAASSPWHVERVYAHLAAKLEGGVGLIVDCCGAPALWSGRRALHDEATSSLREVWRRLGEPQIVTACSSCLKTLGEHLPEMKARSLWTVMADIGWPDRARPNAAGRFAIHDPCTGRHAVEAQRAVRSLAAGLGAAVRELGGAELTTCCGFGGLASFANPEVTGKIVDRRIGESDADYLTYCAMCRDNFARRGKRSIHLLDLIFDSPDGGDPAARPDPGFSRRRENRVRLKARMLSEVWGEDMSEPESEFPLVISDDVRAEMERKLILVEDVARAVAEAERTGRKLADKATGRSIATLRIGEFTCWAEYERTAAGFVLRRAWGHRMQVEAKP